jgi:hypothetical protein
MGYKSYMPINGQTSLSINAMGISKSNDGKVAVAGQEFKRHSGLFSYSVIASRVQLFLFFESNSKVSLLPLPTTYVPFLCH